LTTNCGIDQLKLPRLLKAAVENLRTREGTSFNQFVVMAVAEKVSAMVTAEPFAEDTVRADMAAFHRIVSGKGGESPLPGDDQPRYQ